ncbi:hypothetical protein [Micromonospora sp. NPDC023633]|uniref:hypothetical protein n=1 Tax=Micromonospora sp. NPDC023633 TaxID=3154320 RepID=UPI0033E00FD9
MTTITLPRVPREMTVGGASVAVRLPLEAGAVAHRPHRDTLPAPIPGYPGRTVQAVYANCARDEDQCAEVTAAWADSRGAQACTEPACFPDAEPR